MTVRTNVTLAKLTAHSGEADNRPVPHAAAKKKLHVCRSFMIQHNMQQVENENTSLVQEIEAVQQRCGLGFDSGALTF